MDELVFEIRQMEDPTRESPGRLVGTLLTYEERAKDRPEVFARGALTWPEGGILINEQHNRQSPILRAVPFLDGDQVKIDAALPNTTRGRDAAENLRQGVYTGLSVEFSSRAEGRRGPLREIRAAFLGHLNGYQRTLTLRRDPTGVFYASARKPCLYSRKEKTLTPGVRNGERRLNCTSIS